MHPFNRGSDKFPRQFKRQRLNLHEGKRPRLQQLSERGRSFKILFKRGRLKRRLG
jgi:hypothetical protein